MFSTLIALWYVRREGIAKSIKKPCSLQVSTLPIQTYTDIFFSPTLQPNAWHLSLLENLHFCPYTLFKKYPSPNLLKVTHEKSAIAYACYTALETAHFSEIYSPFLYQPKCCSVVVQSNSSNYIIFMGSWFFLYIFQRLKKNYVKEGSRI